MSLRRLALVAFLLPFLACLPPPEAFQERSAPTVVVPAHDGPIVLLTVPGLRADAIGRSNDGTSSLTPHLDRLAAAAEWSGTAVAPTSSPPASVASLAYGVDPWHHQLSSHLAAAGNPYLRPLGVALGRAGYAPFLHHHQRAAVRGSVHFDGFGDMSHYDDGRVLASLAELGLERRFVWIHLPGFEMPWEGEIDSGERLELAELFPYADPETPLPTEMAETVRRLYETRLQQVDARIGALLAALEKSPAAQNLALILTSPHGLELGEHDQFFYAQNLGRASIEVPLVVDLPPSWTGPTPTVDPDDVPPSLLRLLPTLLELAGADPAPVHPPSLFAAGRGPNTVSSLYLVNGSNRFSGLFRRQGQLLQVRIASRFSAPEVEYFTAQTQQASSLRLGLSESPRRIFDRLQRHFLSSPHWGTEVELRLERWEDDGTTTPIDDPALAVELAAETRQAWLLWKGEARSPDEIRDELTYFAGR